MTTIKQKLNSNTSELDLSNLPIVVKESKVSQQTVTETIVTPVHDEKLQKILTESVSDEEKLKMIRESYEMKVDGDITPDNVDKYTTTLKEWNLSWAGKLFFAGAAAYIAGKVIKNMPLKIRGSKEELKAIADAIVASKAFQDELKKPGASIESVVKKMNLKNVTREKFTAITGKSFPL